ncbi:hypothetical protein KHA94_04490 [Bacillus sp. FJAT-49705]|uniref:Uncharacterized protein n=1 Tax=Cytobacillus citreus TaxID=2833586 RepID=A0ABS5NNT8_9BACI|nr:hypothetical protein [Cytobacillus citreus]MBS4189476.1 hypothetical protein [Cytobacillus citreus]
MVINHAGVLGREYLIAYMKLIISAFECSVDQAKDLTFQRLFTLKEDSMGQETYQQFLLAYKELKELVL